MRVLESSLRGLRRPVPGVAARGGSGGGGGEGVSTGFSAKSASGITNYEAALWNPQNEFDEVTGRYTPTDTSKFYWITGLSGKTGSFTDTEHSLYLRKNGATYARHRAYVNVSSGYWPHHVNGVFQPLAGDYFHLASTSITHQDVWFSAFALIPSSAVHADGGAGASGTLIRNFTEHLDLGGDFDPVTGIFTAPATGYYIFGGGAFPQGGRAGGSHWILDLEIDGVQDLRVFSYMTSNSHGTNLGHTVIRHLTTGQTVAMRASGATGETGWFSAASLPDLSVGFSARKASPSGSAGGIIGAWDTPVDFAVGGGFDAATGVFTVPTSGRHFIAAFGHESPAAVDTDPAPTLTLLLNGAAYHASAHRIGSNYDSRSSHGIAGVVDMIAGQTLSLEQTTHLMGECYFAVIEL